jgi:hypothetical protein
MLSRIWGFIRMLVQRCTLEQHKLIILISVTKPALESGDFQTSFSQRQYRALVDTGAVRSVLSRSVIGELNLMRTGHMQFSSLHGPQTHSRYLAGIGLWAKRIDSDESSSRYGDAELSLYTLEQPFEVVDMENNANFDMILGFDIMKTFSFNFDASRQMFEIVIKR